MYLTTVGQSYYRPMMDGQDWGWGVVMMFVWLVVLVLLVVGVAYLLKGRKPADSVEPEPLDIAKKRYAKGEIMKSEFEQIKKDLVD